MQLHSVASQLADTAACGIAAAAGALVQPLPFSPVLEGVLLTGGRPRYVRGSTAGVGADTSGLTELARGEQPPKIAARFLTPHLTDELPPVPVSG